MITLFLVLALAPVAATMLDRQRNSLVVTPPEQTKGLVAPSVQLRLESALTDAPLGEPWFDPAQGQPTGRETAHQSVFHHPFDWLDPA